MTYRDRDLACPHCGEHLVAFQTGRAKWRCPGCGGILVGAVELEREVAQLTGEPQLELETISGLRATRPCPLCLEPMTAFALFGVDLDRCATDGSVWFDRGELGRVRRDQAIAIKLVDSLLA